MKFTCVAMDFDGCLAYYNDDKTGLFKIFTDIGFTEDEARDAYGDVDEAEGISLNSLVRSLERKSGRTIDRNGLEEKLSSWIESSVTLFPDVLKFLEKVKASGTPIAIVTFGNKEFQTQKIKTSKIIYDELVVTPKDGEKFLALGKLLKHYGAPIVFVDDKPKELDNARKHLAETEISLFRIIRPIGSHINKDAEFEHPEIKNLEEILS